MRKKDWADQTAEGLQDVISEGDDEQLIQVIAEELRKAYLWGLEHQQIGIAHLRAPQRGEMSSYYCTKNVQRYRDERQIFPSELETESARSYIFTWDGHPSVGGIKGKKKVRSD